MPNPKGRFPNAFFCFFNPRISAIFYFHTLLKTNVGFYSAAVLYAMAV